MIFYLSPNLLNPSDAAWRIRRYLPAPRYHLCRARWRWHDPEVWVLRRDEEALCYGSFADCTALLDRELKAYSEAVSRTLEEMDSIGRQLASLGMLDKFGDLYIDALASCVNLLIYGKREVEGEGEGKCQFRR